MARSPARCCTAGASAAANARSRNRSVSSVGCSLIAVLLSGTTRAPRPASILDAARRGKVAHHLLLLRRQRLGHRDAHFDNEIAGFTAGRHALATHTEALAGRCTRWNPDGDLLAVDRAHAHAGTERGLRDVERNVRHEVVALAREEAIGLHLKGDDQIAGRSTVRALAPLTRQAHARAGIGSRRHGNVHRPMHARLPTPLTGRTAFAGHLPAPETHGTRAVHGESALPEGDHATSAALGACRKLRTGRRTGSLARGAFLIDLEFNGDFSAEHGHPKGNGERGLHGLTALRAM